MNWSWQLCTWKTSNIQPKCQGPLQLLSPTFLMTSTTKQMQPGLMRSGWPSWPSQTNWNWNYHTQWIPKLDWNQLRYNLFKARRATSWNYNETHCLQLQVLHIAKISFIHNGQFSHISAVAEYCCPVWQRSTRLPCRCPTAFFHAPHLWHRPVNSIIMAARSHKYWTTSSATQSCHRQVDNAG